MVRVTCIVRPHRLEAVKSAIATLPISGMTVTDVRGTGNSPERAAWLGGEAHLVALPLRSRVEVVLENDLAEPMIELILLAAHTGEPGDGKIFVEPIQDAIRIRTQERGSAAI